MIPSVTKPTRVTNNSATLIDNIFTNNFKDSLKHHQGIFYNDISDHFPIYHLNDDYDLKTSKENFVWKRIITKNIQDNEDIIKLIKVK